MPRIHIASRSKRNPYQRVDPKQCTIWSRLGHNSLQPENARCSPGGNATVSDADTSTTSTASTTKYPSPRAHEFSENPSAHTHQFSSSVHPSPRTHEFSENPSDRTHQFSVHPSGCIHEFSKNPSPRRHQFSSVHPSGCTHEFSENPSDGTHQFSSVHSSARTHAFTVCALTKYTPPFVINGSCPLPNLKKDFIAWCVSTPFSHKQLTLRIGFVTSTPHENRTVSCDRKFSTSYVSFRIFGAVFRLLL